MFYLKLAFNRWHRIYTKLIRGTYLCFTKNYGSNFDDKSLYNIPFYNFIFWLTFFLFYTHMTIWQGDWGAIRMSVARLNIRMKVWPLSLTFNTVVVPICTSALLPCRRVGAGFCKEKPRPLRKQPAWSLGNPITVPSKCLVTGITQAAILILILSLKKKPL